MKELLKERPMLISICMTFLLTVSLAGVSPMIPDLARIFGVSKSQGALILTVYTMPGIFFMPVAAFLADKYGRKVVLLPCLVLFVISGFLCIFVNDFEALLIFRFIHGFAASPFAMLGTTMLGDNYSGVKLAMAMSIGSTAFNISTAISPTLGGILGGMHWRLVFLLPLLGIFVFMLCLKQPFAYVPAKQKGSEYLSSAWQAIKSGRILFLMLLGFFNMMMLLGLLMTCFPFLMDLRYGAQPDTIGTYAAIASIGAAVGAIYVGRNAGRFKAGVLLWTGQGCFLVATAILPLINTSWMNAFPMLIFGLGAGLCTTVVISSLVANSPPSQRAAVISSYTLIVVLSQTIAPVFFSKIVELFGINASFFFGSALSSVMLCISIIILRHHTDADKREIHE